MKPVVQEVEEVSITVLQDNYIDVLAMDGTEVVQRPMPLRDVSDDRGTLWLSPLAEHGFSTHVAVRDGGRTRSMLFDFGCSAHGAAYNADLVGLDLGGVEALALSHGHLDHVGGMAELVARTGRSDLELVTHPGAFGEQRHVRTPKGFRLYFPEFSREAVRNMGVGLRESVQPVPMLGGTALFLGEIPRTCPFERGMPNAFYVRDGEECRDAVDDDSSMVFNLRGRGLVVLSGCAHAGIVNTVRHAVQVAGVEQVHAVIGGFHLTGPAFAHAVEPTIEALKALAPRYVVPAHCTGREASRAIERAMPEEFLLSMSGTTLHFKEQGEARAH